MGKKEQPDQPDTLQDGQEEIHRISDEIIRLKGLCEQGRITEEELAQELAPLARRRGELADLERKEKATKHREWFLAGEASTWDEIEAKLRTKTDEERESYRKRLTEDIEKHAPNDDLCRKWRLRFYEDLEALVHEDGSVLGLLILQHILTFLLYEPWHYDFAEEMRQKRKASRDYYKKKSKGKGSRTPEPELRSVIMTLDDRGDVVIKIPNEPVGRPPKKPENELVQGLFGIFLRLNYTKEYIHSYIKDLLYAFCYLKISDEAIKKITQRHFPD